MEDQEIQGDINLDEMSVEELNDLLAQRNEFAEQYRAETIQLRKVRDQKAVAESLAQKIAAMSPEERSLLQTIAPTGVVSGNSSGQAIQ